MLNEHAHRRFNPLTGEWIIVSPHRTKRPWQGKQETLNRITRPQHDVNCYLCPGNTRANGEVNPPYQDTFVFTNDFAALQTNTPDVTDQHPLLHSQSVQGICRVMCFSPRHDLTLAGMDVDAICQVIHTWQVQISELSATYQWVQLFENKGDIMGCSNPHPHGQIWASDSIPNTVAKEHQQQLDYYQQHQRALLLDYAELEQAQQERIVCQNDAWLIVVPFWALWPYETLLLPKFSVQQLTELNASQTTLLAEILQTLLQGYDKLFDCSFPYSMGWHGAPHNGDNNEHWQLHAHFYPPLLRSASVKKFMVGYELLAEAQRDITAEQAAKQLRELCS